MSNLAYKENILSLVEIYEELDGMPGTTPERMQAFLPNCEDKVPYTYESALPDKNPKQGKQHVMTTWQSCC